MRLRNDVEAGAFVPELDSLLYFSAVVDVDPIPAGKHANDHVVGAFGWGRIGGQATQARNGIEYCEPSPVGKLAG